MSRLVWLSFVVTALLTVASAPAARAQQPDACREWIDGFARPSTPVVAGVSSDVIAAYDDGTGHDLHALRFPAGRVQVVRWTAGQRWHVSLDVPLATGQTCDLVTTTDGVTPSLFFVKRSSTDVTTSELWQCVGSTWSAWTAPAFSVRTLGICDDGGGPELFAAGAVRVGSTVTGRVARWNGSAWTALGPPLANAVVTLATHDAGSGPRLYAGGAASPPIVAGSTVATWNGSTWVAAGAATHGTNVLCAFQGELFAGATVPASSGVSGLRKLTAPGWTAVGPLETTVNALARLDTPAGPRLAIACAGGSFGGVRAWDGVTLSLQVSVPAGSSVQHLATQGGSLLYASGTFTSVSGTACEGLAHTDDWIGGTWLTIGSGLDGPVFTLAAHDFGFGQPQLVAAGNFVHAGHTANLNGVAAWDGTTNTWRPLGGTATPQLWLTVRSIDYGGGVELIGGGANMLGSATVGAVRWNGTSWVPLATDVGGTVRAFSTFATSGGTSLVVGGDFSGASGNFVARLSGSAWLPLGTGTNGTVRALQDFDEGAGPRLFAGGVFTLAGGVVTGGVARWDTSAWSALGTGITGSVSALCVFQGQLYVAGTITNAGGTAVQNLARWNGTTWSNVPGGGSNATILTLCVHDDGRGAALYAGGPFTSIGGIAAASIARFDGASWEHVDGGTDGFVNALASCDDDADGFPGLFAGGSFEHAAAGVDDARNVARLRGCAHHEEFCAGDGTLADHTTPCPCGNTSTSPGYGCANSVSWAGSHLAAGGDTRPDTLRLAVENVLTTTTGLFLQHASAGDQVFHDGVLCASGSLVRLRTRTSNGSGQLFFPDVFYPPDQTTSVSRRGGVLPGSGVTRYYAFWYRNAASSFCPPATANVTNGVRVTW